MGLLPATSASTHGQITIDATVDVNLHSKWCRVLNFPEVLGSGPKRGSDRIIPHLAGVRAQRRRRTAAELVFELIVAGDQNAAGDPYSSYSIGLESNLNTLTALCDDPGGDGTRTVTVTWPSTATSATPCHILEVAPGEILAPGVVRATMSISIPAGRF